MKYFRLILVAVVFLTSCKLEKPLKEPEKKTSATDNSKEESLFSIIAVGDIMMGTTYPSKDLPPGDGETLFEDVSDILQSADLTLGNLEGPFLNSGGTPKQCRDSASRCYSFRVPERYGAYLSDAGFDFMNLANNHAGDMGEAGRTATYNVLDENEILYAGTTDYPYVVADVKGIKVGIAGFAPNRGTVSINDLDYAAELVKEIKSRCDFVIVFFHGGAEGAGAQHVPKREEIFLGENRGDVYEFAHTVIDAGADAVFGSGPHVTRAVEIYKKKFIAYSLGNFCTYGKFSLAGPQGVAPIIKLYVDRSGNFRKAEVTSVKQVRRGFPVRDEIQTAYRNIMRLSREDFPRSPAVFSDDGLIE